MLDFILRLDSIISIFFENLVKQFPQLYTVFSYVTFLGNFVFVSILFVLLSIYFIYQNKIRQFLLPLWLSVFSSLIITYSIKYYFNTQGPIGRTFTEFTPSFPSAHATVVVSFYGIVYFLLNKKIKNKMIRKSLFIGTLALIFLIGLSRLVLDVHFLSDVLVGYIVGAFSLYSGIMLARKSK